MHRAIYLGGVKGVGKTTLIESIISKTSYKVVDLTFWMMEYMSKERDALDNITIIDRAQAREYAFQKSLDSDDPSEFILDSHFSIPNDFGHERGFSLNYASYLGPFILVIAKPKLILERKEQDKQRQRSSLSLAEIIVDMKIERSYAEYIAEVTNQKLFIIENNIFELAQQSLLNVLSKISEDD